MSEDYTTGNARCQACQLGDHRKCTHATTLGTQRDEQGREYCACERKGHPGFEIGCEKCGWSHKAHSPTHAARLQSDHIGYCTAA